MEQQSEQGTQAPERIHSPSSWADKLVESSKIAPEEDKQSLAPQEELSEVEDEAEAELETEEPTSEEELDEEEEEEAEESAEESEETDETEESATDTSIVADGTYVIDGEEIDGQTLINGIAATKNFSQEKQRLRVEAQEQLDTELGQLHTQRDEYAAGLNFMLGMNQQSQQQYANVNWMQLQQENPAEYQRLKTDQGKLIANQQQLQGQFDQFLTNVRTDQAETSRKGAESSISILRDTFGGEEGWSKRYPELRKVADSYGFKAAEFNAITDHRLMTLLDSLDNANKKLSEIESNAKKKTANPVKGKKRRNSARVNTSQNRKMSDAHTQFMTSRSPKDAAKMLMQSSAGPKGRK